MLAHTGLFCTECSVRMREGTVIEWRWWTLNGKSLERRDMETEGEGEILSQQYNGTHDYCKCVGMPIIH